MNAEEILMKNVKADCALLRRIELRDEAAQIWAERDQVIEEAMRDRGTEMFTAEQLGHFEELAKASEYLEWLCDRLYKRSYIPVPLSATEDGPDRYKCNGHF